MKYTTLTAPLLTLMDKVVNDYIRNGWKPQGGVSETKSGYYIQAMIKEE
jgi:hypothetical protein